MQAVASESLSDAQIASLARQAGFPENEIPTAVAVAKAESSGNPKAHNTKPPDNSYGLWQINMYGKLGPDRLRAFGISDNNALFDPATNARAAYQIWKQQGWKGWSTYNNGSYRASMSIDPSTDTSAATAGITDLAGPITGPILEKALGSKIDQYTEKTRQVAVTYMIILVALVLLILGVVILNRQTVMGAIPQGRILKAAGAVAGGLKK